MTLLCTCVPTRVFPISTALFTVGHGRPLIADRLAEPKPELRHSPPAVSEANATHTQGVRGAHPHIRESRRQPDACQCSVSYTVAVYIIYVFVAFFLYCFQAMV